MPDPWGRTSCLLLRLSLLGVFAGEAAAGPASIPTFNTTFCLAALVRCVVLMGASAISAPSWHAKL
jgi:hypothetical protein